MYGKPTAAPHNMRAEKVNFALASLEILTQNRTIFAQRRSCEFPNVMEMLSGFLFIK